MRAHIGNKAVAGKAYDRLVEAMKAGDVSESNKRILASMQRIADTRQLTEREQDYMDRLKRRIDEAK